MVVKFLFFLGRAIKFHLSFLSICLLVCFLLLFFPIIDIFFLILSKMVTFKKTLKEKSSKTFFKKLPFFLHIFYSWQWPLIETSWKPAKNKLYKNNVLFLIIFFFLYIRRLADRSWGWPEGSVFKIYYTEV